MVSIYHRNGAFSFKLEKTTTLHDTHTKNYEEDISYGNLLILTDNKYRFEVRDFPKKCVRKICASCSTHPL